jgi:hypothetical protein
LLSGTEHFVELAEGRSRVVKVTLPPAFGLISCVTSTPIANVRNAPSFTAQRKQIESVRATPLEYLSRWILVNEVFQDDVRLESVILWDCGLVSLSISQPQYHGRPATSREIESNLIRDGWTLCSKEASGTVFYNYAHKVLAVDVLPRNCYMNEGSFLPFDVILQRPGLELEDFLELY